MTTTKPLFTVTIRHLSDSDVNAVKFVLGGQMKFNVEVSDE